MRYRLVFHGRQVGAIGIMHAVDITIESTSEEQARIDVYDTHEHISNLEVTEVSDSRLGNGKA